MELTLFDLPKVAPHPAKYTDDLLPVMAEMVKGATRILDPFGGTGKIFQLKKYGVDAEIHAIELEPEWANCHPDTQQGNALDLPFPDDYFDAIVTSPTYGNRMADSHDASDDSYRSRNTYTHTIRRKLHPDNSGAMQWGKRYREFHIAAWKEAKRVLLADGLFVLNTKDHIRGGERQHVTRWHSETLWKLGFVHVETELVDCPGYKGNSDLILDYESVALFRLVRK